MTRWISALVSCSLISLGLSACGDDKKENHFASGVDGNAQLGNLTPDQKVTICTNQAKFVRASVDTTSLMRFVCAFTPQVFLAATDQACETNLQACIDALAVKIDVQVTDQTNAQTVCAAVPISQCQGTVSDYENCVDSLANIQLTIGTDFACGKRQQYADGPTVGVNACAAVGPACTAAAEPVIR